MGIGVQANLPGSALNTDGPSFPSAAASCSRPRGLAQGRSGRQPSLLPLTAPIVGNSKEPN